MGLTWKWPARDHASERAISESGHLQICALIQRSQPFHHDACISEGYQFPNLIIANRIETDGIALYT